MQTCKAGPQAQLGHGPPFGVPGSSPFNRHWANTNKFQAPRVFVLRKLRLRDVWWLPSSPWRIDGGAVKHLSPHGCDRLGSSAADLVGSQCPKSLQLLTLESTEGGRVTSLPERRFPPAKLRRSRDPKEGGAGALLGSPRCSVHDIHAAPPGLEASARSAGTRPRPGRPLRLPAAEPAPSRTKAKAAGAMPRATQ